jgi:hypothetical protein
MAAVEPRLNPWDTLMVPDPPPPAVPTRELFFWRLDSTFQDDVRSAAVENFLAKNPKFLEKNENYIRFTENRVLSLFFLEPDAGETPAMISLTCYQALIKARSSRDWSLFESTTGNSKPVYQIAARLWATGKPQLMTVSGKTRGNRNPLQEINWEGVYVNMTKPPKDLNQDPWDAPMRSIDPETMPPIKVYMVPTGTVYDSHLQNAIKTLETQKSNVKVIYAKDRASVPAGMVMVCSRV